MANPCTCCSTTPSPSPSPSPPPWREIHGYHPAPSTHIEHYCFWYSVASIVVLTFYIATIRCMRRNRTHMPNDSMVVLHYWPRLLRITLPLVFVLIMLVPLLLFVCGHLCAIILALSEDWPYLDTFEYLLCNMVALPPMNALTPTTTFGNFVDVAVNVLETVFTATIIGLCAAMAWVDVMQELLPQTLFGLVFSIVLISVVYVALGLLCSVVMSLLEGESVSETFLFTITIMCGIGNPLTPWVPESDAGNFFAALCSVVQLGIGGAIVGVLGGHAKMGDFITLLQGEHVEHVEHESGLEVPDQSLQPVSQSNFSFGDAHVESESQSKILQMEETISRLREENQRLNKMLHDTLEQHKVQQPTVDSLQSRSPAIIENRFPNRTREPESMYKDCNVIEHMMKLIHESEEQHRKLKRVQDEREKGVGS